ncbi:MAG: M48 family metalloprotease [Myxococcota bacterium]
MTTYVSLSDFAETWHRDDPRDVPPWVVAAHLPLDQLGVRERLEDILDTVTALQRADWLEDGVYIGPTALGDTYKELLHCSRRLHIAVPPAVAAGAPMSMQGAFGTDGRAFLYLSTFFLSGTSESVKQFQLGRLCGHIAARQVTANSLYAMVVDQNGLRSVARRAVGPLLEVFMAPLSLGVRLALSHWHRAAEMTADRAGLLCSRDMDAAGKALLKLTMGVNPTISHQEYLDQLKRVHESSSPGRWAELMSARPWTHKRLKALELFADSAMYARLTDREPAADALSDEDLAARTNTLLGVG